MSLIMHLEDEADALEYLKQGVGEDCPCYLALRRDFVGHVTFIFGSAVVNTLVLVAICMIDGDGVGGFETFAYLFGFLLVTLGCCVFDSSTRIGFWKWNRYYRLWCVYKRKGEGIPMERLMLYSEHYAEKDFEMVRSYKRSKRRGS